MKFLFIILFVLYPSICFGVYGWKLIKKTKDSEYYIDMKSLIIKNDKRFFLRLRDYKKIDKYGEKSNIIYFETDCKKFKTRFLKDMYFEDHMGMGKSKILNEVGEWITIQKNSIGEYFNNFICSIKK